MERDFIMSLVDCLKDMDLFVILNNGSNFEGRMTGEKDGKICFLLADESTLEYPMEDIATISEARMVN